MEEGAQILRQQMQEACFCFTVCQVGGTEDEPFSRAGQGHIKKPLFFLYGSSWAFRFRSTQGVDLGVSVRLFLDAGQRRIGPRFLVHVHDEDGIELQSFVFP